MMRRFLVLILLWLVCGAWTAGWQKPPQGTQINWSHPLARNLIHYWAMNEYSGNSANDLAGGDTLLFSATAPTWKSGGIETTALDSFMIGTKNLWGNQTGFTFFCEYYRTQNTAGTQYIAAIATAGGALDFIFYITTTNTIGVYLDTDLGNFDSNIWPEGTIADNVSERKRIAVTWSASTGKILLYINGTLVRSASRTGNKTALTAGAKPYFFNREDKIREAYANIVQAGYWNTALSPSEVAWLHREPYAMLTSSFAQKPWLNFGSGGAPPAAAPVKKRAQLILSKLRENIWQQKTQN